MIATIYGSVSSADRSHANEHRPIQLHHLEVDKQYRMLLS